MAKFPVFREGVSKRPDIHHDHGFLDDGKGNIDPSKRRAPTWDDYKELIIWEAKLEGAQVLRPDLVNATDAYAHFLDASGTDLKVAYDSFLMDDASGKIVLASAVDDVTAATLEIHDKKMKAAPASGVRKDEFQICSDSIAVGGSDDRYPYPDSENWQKAIGAHFIWIEAKVAVTVDQGANSRKFEIKMAIHMEDMYNFNPGAKDIATGTPDSANGRFEVTGLGKEFLSKAEVTRTITFSATLAPVPDVRVKPKDQNVSRS